MARHTLSNTRPAPRRHSHAQYHFETPSPVDLVVEISKGNVHVRRAPTTSATVVTVEGKDADDVVVEQRGDTSP